MPRYMTLFEYTADAVSAMKGTGEDRSQAVRDAVQQADGQLIDFYFTFGEYDGLFIFEVDDDETAQAVVMTVVSAGHLASERTINLHTVEEKQRVLQKAGDLHHSPPQH